MTQLDRRQFVARVGALAVAPMPPLGAMQPRPCRILLNSGFSGPQAFFFLADERGYFRDGGIAVEFVGGDGAAAIVPRIEAEGFDAGYGDLNALITLAGSSAPGTSAVAVYVAFNTTPLTVAVAADGPIRTPRDLEGRAVGGHPKDAALEAFPLFARAVGIDASRVALARSDASMRALVEQMLAGKTAGVFGFVHTILASVAPAGIGRDRLRFFEYRDHVPELYGNALMVSPRMLRERPDDVRALVRAANRGLAETAASPEAAIAALVRRDATVNPAVDGPRLAGTLEVEMGHPEGARLGIGDVDDARLARSIALVTAARGLARAPAPDEIFTRRFLPPDAEKVRTLARLATAAAPRRLRIVLNSDWTGANAWICLAEDRGYLRAAGIELAFTPGRGAFTAAGRMVDERFDAGYGDINALVEQAATRPAEAPQAVSVLFNQSPSVIAVPSGSTVRAPRDLEGRTVIGHATDVALNTFAAFARRTGVDASRVRVVTDEGGMGDLVKAMLAGRADALFGYDTTITAALATAGMPAGTLRFLRFREHVPELYGSALMVRRGLVESDPAVVEGLVLAMTRGVMDALADPDAAVAALLRRAPSASAAVERARLLGTLDGDMGHPELRRLGVGDVDDARFARAVALVSETRRLPRTPAAADVFTRRFLPPLAGRLPKARASAR